MGEVFAGRYELVDPIGHGGVGAVWRAWDHRRRRYVAAKVLQQRDAHALLRFVREQAMRIDHPHVLAPASWAADDDKVLFTMDLVAGGSLVHLVADYGPLPPLFVCTLLDQLLSGLTAVHAEGVVHRDIKPANVLLEATGRGRPRLRLSDFGIAMRLGEPRLTETNYVVGTPGYFAPEQMLGSDPDFPADLFAVGLVALYLLEGARPDAKALIEYFAENGTPSAPQGIPEPLWQVVATLVQPDPEARFRTATGARKALASAAELLPEPGPDDESIDVFDQLGPLPDGFGADGPLGATRGGHAVGAPLWPRSTAPAAQLGSGEAMSGAGSGVGSASGPARDSGFGGGDGGGGGGSRRLAGDRDGASAEPGVSAGPEGSAGPGVAGPLGIPGWPEVAGEPGVAGGVGAAADPAIGPVTGPSSASVFESRQPGSDPGAISDPGSGFGPGPSYSTGSDPGYSASSDPSPASNPGTGSDPWPHRSGLPSQPSAASGAVRPGPGTDGVHPASADDDRQPGPALSNVRPNTPANDGGAPPHPASAPGPVPPPPSAMSETGSFHLPPPQAAAPNAQPQQAWHETQHRPAPGQQPQPQPQRPEQPPTPPTAVQLPVPTPPYTSPFDPTPTPTPTQVPASPHTAMPQHAYASTGSYTAQDPQVPPRAGAFSERVAGRARPRPGPPAKVAVPVLLLALVCFAVGIWALTRI
ncbi:protein kinase [Streptomyces sp. NPDC127072]|uniref:serine/threonine-protein kinase n=1 Tax=Streptomyces sp. NPDC127072 TaxID=3347129 RepID=UPI003667AFD4